MSGEYMHGILVAKCRKEIESGKTMAISVSPIMAIRTPNNSLKYMLITKV